MKSLGRAATGLRLERMQASPLWAGSGFRNRHPIAPGLRDHQAPRPSLSEFICHAGRRVPQAPLPGIDPRPAWAHKPQSGLRATWLGHSTVLIEIDGLRLLTDPVWGQRASPTSLAGPKRFQSVPLPLSALTEVDAVLVSHDHYDHLDYATIVQLAKRPIPFITSLGVGAHLEAFGVAPQFITELDWWQSHTLAGSGVCITAAPAQHFSGRSLSDRNATLWSSFAIRGESHGVFFSGDTGLTSEYASIGQRLGPFDVVMLEVGAWHPSWGDIHLGPANAVAAYRMLGGGALLPVHWGTFSLALHDWDEPVETLLALAGAANLPLLLPRLGQAVEPARAADAQQPWWREQSARERGAPQRGPITEPQPEPAGTKAFAWPVD